MTGYGTYTYRNGKAYKGLFLLGKYHGEGELIDTDGTRVKAE